MSTNGEATSRPSGRAVPSDDDDDMITTKNDNNDVDNTLVSICNRKHYDDSRRRFKVP